MDKESFQALVYFSEKGGSMPLTWLLFPQRRQRLTIDLEFNIYSSFGHTKYIKLNLHNISGLGIDDRERI